MALRMVCLSALRTGTDLGVNNARTFGTTGANFDCGQFITNTLHLISKVNCFVKQAVRMQCINRLASRSSVNPRVNLSLSPFEVRQCAIPIVPNDKRNQPLHYLSLSLLNHHIL